MAPQNLNPHDELKSLDQQVEIVNDLAGLKPIFFRLEEIARDNPNDFQVQLSVGDIKQHLVNRSAKIKQNQETMPPMPAMTSSDTVAPAAEPTVMLKSFPGPPAVLKEGPATLPPPPRPTASESPTMPFAAVPPPPPRGAQPPPMAPPLPLPRAQQPPVMQPPPAAPPPMMPTPPPATPPPPPRATPAAPPIPPPAPPAMGPGRTGERPPAAPPPGPAPAMVPPPSPTPAVVVSGPPTMRMQAQPVPAGSGAKAPPPKAASASSSGGWKKPVLIGGIVGAVLALGGVGFLLNQKRKAATNTTASSTPLTTAGIAVAINTTPTGAMVRIKNDTKVSECTSNCSVTLDPGDYQVTAFLDGYEPAASGLSLKAGAAAPPLNLTLEAQPQTLRVLTDLMKGKVTVDDMPAGDLTDGQFVLENVAPGTHVVKLVSGLSQAQFTVEVAIATAPKIVSPVVARNLFAVLVSTIGTKARVSTSAGPLKLMANGQPEDEVSPQGVDIKNFQGGVLELAAGEGKDQRTVKESYGPAPTLTAFFKSDQNIGTLIVATGEDDARVFVNGKEFARKTQRGQLRIPAIGAVTVRVMKDGFLPTDQQMADVKKGAEVRMEFKLKPAPVMISLQIRGGTPGSEVVIDQRTSGLVGADGSYNSTVLAGDHVIDLRHDGFTPKHLQRSFRAGQPVTISGVDAVLVAERLPPPPDKVTIGSTSPPAAPKPAQTVRLGTMDDWETPNVWRKEDDGTYIHRGAAWIPYKLPARGTFTFTVQLQKGGNIFRSGKIRWAANYVDAKNYALYEIDNKNFWAKVVENGKTLERAKMPHGIDSKDKSFTIRVDITPDHLTQSIQRGGMWAVLDDWTEAGRKFTEGKFGFLVQGDDQIGISDFKFQPK